MRVRTFRDAKSVSVEAELKIALCVLQLAFTRQRQERTGAQFLTYVSPLLPTVRYFDDNGNPSTYNLVVTIQESRQWVINDLMRFQITSRSWTTSKLESQTDPPQSDRCPLNFVFHIFHHDV